MIARLWGQNGIRLFAPKPKKINTENAIHLYYSIKKQKT